MSQGTEAKRHEVSCPWTSLCDGIAETFQFTDAERMLLETVGLLEETKPLLMDRAYEDDERWLTAWGLQSKPVVPPKRNRVKLWNYDKELYKRRNEVERFFRRRIQAFRCVFTRYEKLDRMFTAFVFLACICITLRSVNTL